MKKVQKLTSMILCIAMLLSLCACGSTEEKTVEAETKNVQSSSVDTSDKQSNGTGNAEYTLSEYLALGETIWYQIGEYEGKDSYVEKIFVIEPDGSLYVADGITYTLGELEQMKDADIVELVKQLYAEELVTSVAYATNTTMEEPEYVNLYYSSVLFSGDGVYTIVNNGVNQENVLSWLSNYGTPTEQYLSVLEREWESIEAALNGFAKLMEHPIIQASGGSDIIGILSPLKNAPSTDLGVERVMEELGYYNKSEYGDVETLKSAIAEAAELMDVARTNIANTAQVDYENYLNGMESDVKPAQYRLALQSGETGNNTHAMILAYVIDTPNGQKDYTINLYYDYPVQDADGKLTNCNHEVYDSLYGGYRYGQNGRKFYTRGEDGLHFVLDKVGESDLPVDVEDMKSLFD